VQYTTAFAVSVVVATDPIVVRKASDATAILIFIFFLPYAT
jgi:hypothetical protein